MLGRVVGGASFRRPGTSQSRATSAVSAPGRAGPLRTAVGVAEKRGAGAGWVMPPWSVKVPRAARCGWCGASRRDSTGATQASEPSKTAVHSSRVRVLKRAATASRSSPQRGRVLAGRGLVLDAEQVDELGVELRLQGADRHVPAVGGLVRAVEGAAAVEEVGAAAVLPAAGGEHAVDHRGEVGGAVDDGRVHDLAGAGRAGVVEGGEDADDEVERAARVVAEQVGGGGRRAVRGPIMPRAPVRAM